MRGRSLIAAVGQPWMRDLAFGSHVVTFLQSERLPDEVDVRDLSFSPIAALQMIEDGGYDCAVFITSNAVGRRRGEVYESPAAIPSISRHELRARIGDCVMGCVSLDSLLILCQARGVLPSHAAIIDIEPEDDGWGPELSDGVALLVAAAARRAIECLARLQQA